MPTENENVKIVINEKDKTSPINRGTSSDIVFVPGFTSTADLKGITLFTSLSEFKKIVGASPKNFSPSTPTTPVYDKNYIYAYELLRRGMPVLYCCVSTTATEFSIDGVTLRGYFEQLLDKNTYSVKYLTTGALTDITCSTVTTGGEPTTTYTADVAKFMIQCAALRGDAVAVVDYQKDTDHVVYGIEPKLSDGDAPTDTVYSRITQALVSMSLTADELSFATAMYPWAEYETTFGKQEMSPSFAYLMCIATAIKSSPNWLAMAGVTRGLVPNINKLIVKDTLTNAMAEECQPSSSGYSINCITDVRPYGLTIWGNRTLKPVSTSTTALNFLNIRNMISDVKKLLYSTAKSVMFEQNSDSLWLRFKSGVSPLLNQLKSGNAIQDFKIVKNPTNYAGETLRRGELSATIRIFPLYAVEYFELTVEISDQDVSVN